MQNLVNGGGLSESAGKRLLLGVLVIMGLTGCTAYRTEPPLRAASFELTEFLREGETRYESLEQEWGPPLQGGRIRFYRLEGKSNKVRFSREGGAWDRSRYSLVLIFDQAGLLERSSIVRVR
jgi:hypothetical protein